MAPTSLPPPWERFYPHGLKADYLPPVGSVPEMFLAACREHAGRTALIYRDRRMSYDELARQAARVANALRRRGVRRGDTVALYLPNTLFHPIFFFGTLIAGARVTHLSPLDAPRELAFKIRDSGARMLVTLSMPPFGKVALGLREQGVVADVVLCDEDAAWGAVPGAPALPPIPPEAIAWSDFVAGMDDGAVPEPVAIADIALLQYTGGTTGSPKAAMLTHANLTASVGIYTNWSMNDPGFAAGTSTLVVLPLFHIMALTAILLRRIKEGGTLIIHQRFDLEKALDDIEKYRISGVAGVPTNWIAFANHAGVATRDFSSLKVISSGGAPLAVDIVHRIEKITGLRLRGGWGMTETAAAGTNIPPDCPPGKAGTIGIPLPGVWIDIVSVDDPMKVLPPGETGEIRIKAPNVTAGYWNRPDETAVSFADSHLLTGDIGRMDKDGFFYLVDRKKDLIISSGYNVYPQPIEDAIIEHPDVAEVLVIGIPDAYRGEAAKAFVVLRPGRPEFTLEELKAFLCERLGRHEMPQLLTFRADLPKTPVGKYSRKLLREQELGAGAKASLSTTGNRHGA